MVRSWLFRMTFGYLVAWMLFGGVSPLLMAQPVRSAVTDPGFASLPPLSPKMDCASLASADLSAAVGARTHIDSAVEVPNGKPAPYCNVLGTITPKIQFQVLLPLSRWTQRYLQTGCGGFCGSTGIRLENADGCTPATNGELVLAATNMGHTGQMSDASGFKDAQTRLDFAYRGQHLTTLAAKALIQQFYGQAPKYSYFSGCSDGGREALMEAQRFPNDFNGIIAGDPASNFISQNTFGSAWSRYVDTGADGKPIFTGDKLVLLHNAVLAQCDALDGAKDVLISDPLACHFDARVIQCKAGQDPANCLTPAQVKVVNEIYAGPHDARGNRLAPGGMLPGSEANWAGPVVPAAGEEVGTSEMAESAYKYLAYEKNPPETSSSRELKFDRASFDATTKLNRLYDATDPDLSAFKAHGGKLILYHGLADPAISPLNTIFYYTEVQQTMGKAAAEQFTRLYLFPGVSHCGGGEGPFHPDFLSAIMEWVEKSQAPNMILSARYSTDMKVKIGLPPGPPANQRAGGAGGPGGPGGGPGGRGGGQGGPGGPGGPGGRGPQISRAPAGPPERTLPIFPYPATPRYTGTGSVTDAKNFVAGPPDPAPASLLTWVGSGEYTSHHAVWCEAQDPNDDQSMTCKATQ